MIRLFSLFIRTIIVLALLIGPVSALSGSVLAQEPTPNDNPGPGNNGPISIKSATVSNGVVQIGVHDYGNLVDNNTAIGLQYVPTGGDAITPGCWCEGWGVGDATSGAAGWADWAVGGFTNLSLVDFTSTGTTAISVVDVAGTLPRNARFSSLARHTFPLRSPGHHGKYQRGSGRTPIPASHGLGYFSH